MGIPSFWEKHSPVKALGLTIFGILLFAFLLYNYGKTILTQRFILLIKNESVYLKDVLFHKTTLLDDSFKGYSYSSYGDGSAVRNFKTLLFYFTDGRIIEFPQFLFTNFKHIHGALSDAKVNFLGDEPYIWKNLISRVYHFK